MSQEAIMIAVDNSDFMRNGDYIPNRLQAQIDAFNYFTNAKKRMNVENTCGLVTLANYQVVCTLTTDMSKLHSKITLVDLSGNINFCTTVRVSQLALRHRQSRNQKPRIVVFVGSPINEEEAELVKLAKKLKKEKVNIDVISFGESEENQHKLTAFIDTINGKDGAGSHLVTIPAGSSLQESLKTSPILMNEESGNLGAVGFGMEEIDDPDLLYALRVSMEDQRMQQERAGITDDVNAMGQADGVVGTSEEDMLREAMAASLSDNMGGEVDFSSMTEDEQIAYATRMSLQDESAAGANYGEVMDTAGGDEPQKEQFDVVDNPDLIGAVLEGMDQDEEKQNSTPKDD